MRETKFRAWDALDSKMYYFTFDDLISDVMRPPLHPGSCDWYLMQFTGLTDKNGKEIYEDDIVKAPMDFGPGGFQVRTTVVNYRAISGYQWNYFNLDKLEVIGNVHENGDLLK